jgi:SAM-dependent methyltransferase
VPLIGFRDRLERHRDLRRASATLAATDPTGDTARLLSGVSLRVHPADPMYVRGEAERYLAVGLSATRVIREAVQTGSKNLSIGAVLDFPCGYGRVLRFLRALFPSSRITGAELDANALRFCRRSFGIDIWQVTPDPASLTADRRFDLIWCGSLLTHFDERKALSLLQLFYQSLAEPGVCIVSAHGATSIEWIRAGRYTYGLTSSGHGGTAIPTWQAARATGSRRRR